MKRFRLSTAMPLVVVAALIAALLVQRHRSALREVEFEVRTAEIRVKHAQTMQVLVKQNQMMALQARERAAMENELAEAKILLKSEKSNAAKDERAVEKK